MSLGGQQAFLLAEDVADPEKRGCTIVRMLLGLSLSAATPGVVSGSMRITMGISMVSDDAFVAAALPEADTTADFPVSGWLYRDEYRIVDETLASGVIMLTRVEKDLRTQRKMDRSSLVFQLESNLAEGTAFDVRCTGIVRALYKLP